MNGVHGAPAEAEVSASLDDFELSLLPDDDTQQDKPSAWARRACVAGAFLGHFALVGVVMATGLGWSVADIHSGYATAVDVEIEPPLPPVERLVAAAPGEATLPEAPNLSPSPVAPELSSALPEEERLALQTAIERIMAQDASETLELTTPAASPLAAATAAQELSPAESQQLALVDVTGTVLPAEAQEADSDLGPRTSVTLALAPEIRPYDAAPDELGSIAPEQFVAVHTEEQLEATKAAEAAAAAERAAAAKRAAAERARAASKRRERQARAAEERRQREARQARAAQQRREREARQAKASAAASERRRYAANVRARVAAYRPSMKGPATVSVSFAIAPNGSLRYARLARRSGRFFLDMATLMAVRRAAPFPKPPAGMTPGQLSFTVPFHYK